MTEPRSDLRTTVRWSIAILDEVVEMAESGGDIPTEITIIQNRLRDALAASATDEGPCPRCGVTVNHWTGYPDGWTCDPQEVAAYRLAALRSKEPTE